MRISDDGIDLIRRFEGRVLMAYQDVAGVWTIGYGHTGPVRGYPSVAAAVEANDGHFEIDELEAAALLKEQLKVFQAGVNAALTAPVTQSMFDALVSLAYNIGVAAFRRSTVLSRVNAGDWGLDFLRLRAAFLMWSKARVGGQLKEIPGLVRRRSAEWELAVQDGAPERVVGQPAPELVALNDEDGVVECPGGCRMAERYWNDGVTPLHYDLTQ